MATYAGFVCSSDAVLHLGAVVVLHIVEAVPHHDAAVLANALDSGEHRARQRAGFDVPAAGGLGRRRQAEVEAPRRDAAGPRAPGVHQVGVVAVGVRAPGVVVELDPHVVELPRLQRGSQRRVRVRALRRRRQQHAPFALERGRQVVVVRRLPVLDVEVDAVEHGGAQRACRAVAAAQVAVPQVVGHAVGVVGGGQAVAAGGAADGEEHLDALRLAGLDVAAQARAAAGARVTVPGEVQDRGLSVAEGREERQDDVGVQPGVAGVR